MTTNKTLSPFYGATSSFRWSKCSGSLALQSNSSLSGPTAPRGTTRAAEVGAVQHRIAEMFLMSSFTERQALIDKIAQKEVGRLTTPTGHRKLQNGPVRITDEIINNGLAYRGFLEEEAKQHEFAALEKEVSWSHLVKSPKAYGAPDAMLFSEKEKKLTLVDYKTGLKKVEPDSSQLKLYALGALALLEENEEPAPTEVSLVIFQPTLSTSVRRVSFTPAELDAWALENIAPTVQQVQQGQYEYNEGSWCEWCVGRYKGTCPKAASS